MAVDSSEGEKSVGVLYINAMVCAAGSDSSLIVICGDGGGYSFYPDPDANKEEPSRVRCNSNGREKGIYFWHTERNITCINNFAAPIKNVRIVYANMTSCSTFLRELMSQLYILSSFRARLTEM